MEKQHHESPKNHIIGFALSLILTFAALYVTLDGPFTKEIKITLIFVLAVFQLLVQLLFFMHLTEGEDKVSNIINMAFSIFIAITIVGGSIWILLYNTMAH